MFCSRNQVVVDLSFLIKQLHYDYLTFLLFTPGYLHGAPDGGEVIFDIAAKPLFPFNLSV